MKLSHSPRVECQVNYTRWISFNYKSKRACKGFSADSPDTVKADKGAALDTVFDAIGTLQEEGGLESVEFKREREG